MSYLLYNVVLFLFFPFLAVFYAIRILYRPSYRMNLAQRLGVYPEELFQNASRNTIWIHAVSVGEVISSGLLISSLRNTYPDAAIVVSTVTPTGHAIASERLDEADAIIYLPFDLTWVVSAAAEKIAPRLFIFLETEIWPNLLRELSKQRVPTVMVNGRISDHAYRRYRWVAPLLPTVMRHISLLLMQTEHDAEKVRALGAVPSRVKVTGNMKYDQAHCHLQKDDTLRVKIGLTDRTVFVVAGSTHPGEEEEILVAFSLLVFSFLGQAESAVLLLAPRHLKRLQEVESLCQQRGHTVLRKSQLFRGQWQVPPHPILLLDTIGEMNLFYGIADLIFVGGSLVPVGGHNLLEPAAWKKPVFFGPHTHHSREIADQLKSSGGGIEVANGLALGQAMRQLWRNPEMYRTRGEQAYQVVVANTGAVDRNLSQITKLYAPSGHRLPGRHRPL